MNTPKSAYLSLRRRQQLFVDAYVDCGVGSEAMRTIGYKGEPRFAACRYMQNPTVLEAIEERTAEAIAEAGVNSVKILRELARVAFFDHRRLFDADGKVLPTHKLPDDVAAGLAGIEIEELFAGSLPYGTLRKYRAWPKVEALKLLMQHKRLLVEKHEFTGKDGVPLAPPVINIGFGNGGPGSTSA